MTAASEQTTAANISFEVNRLFSFYKKYPFSELNFKGSKVRNNLINFQIQFSP